MAKCGEQTEVFSRVTGYFRPVKNWNRGKQQEFRDRKVYDPAKSTEPKTHGHEDVKHLLSKELA